MPTSLCILGEKKWGGQGLFFTQAALGIFWLLGEAGSPMNSNMSCIQIGTGTILEATRVSESQAKLNVSRLLSNELRYRKVPGVILTSDPYVGFRP